MLDFTYSDIESIEEINEIEIGKFYEIVDGVENETRKDGFRKDISQNILSLSMNKNKKLEYKHIPYVWKHKVQKELFKIIIGNEEVIITKDHSIIVLRNNELISEKPKNIKSTDMLYSLQTGWTTNYEIIPLGVQEEWVYDIEVKDNHNFFGNNILVHNSGYVKIDKIVEKIINKKFGKSFEEFTEDETKQLTDYILKFIENEIQPIINKAVKEVQDILNSYHKGFVGAKVEKIMSRGIWVSKKKNAVAKIWEEGSYYTTPTLSVTGLDLVRSSTPEFAKEVFEKAILIMLLQEEKDLQHYLKEVKKEFKEKAKISEGIRKIARITGVNSLDYTHYPEGWYKIHYDNKGNIIKKLPAPINSRASILYNQYIKENNLEERFELIEEGNKIKFIYLKVPNPISENVIAFMDEEFLDVAKLVDYIDVELQYEKIIEQPLKIINDVLSWELKKTSSLTELF